MEDLEKSIRVNNLFAYYGKLLSPSQEKMVRLYFEYDLSLSEIALQEGVSRNAVHDAIKKGIEGLENYESKLHLLDKEQCLKKELTYFKDKLSAEDYSHLSSLLTEEK